MDSPARLPLAISMGDACGIGPEIVARLFLEGSPGEAFVVGDLAVMRRAAASIDGLLPVAAIGTPGDAAQLPPRCVPVLQATALPPDLIDAVVGQVDARAGAAAAACIAQAVAWVRRGDAAAVVTAPIHKEASRRRGCALSRPHRDAAGARGDPRHRSTRPHDAGQRRAARRPGDDPHLAAPGHRRRDPRRRAVDHPHGAHQCRAWHRPTSDRGGRPQSACRRRRTLRRRGTARHRAGDRGSAARGHRRQRPLSARHGLHARPPRAGAPGGVRPWSSR